MENRFHGDLSQVLFGCDIDKEVFQSLLDSIKSCGLVIPKWCYCFEETGKVMYNFLSLTDEEKEIVRKVLRESKFEGVRLKWI